MPDLVEQMYCSQQINIPPNLPYILKQYAKAAIRTQPYDLLFWSAAYFRAKADKLPPPVKERIEYPPVDTPSGLSPGFLKVLHKQLGGSAIVKRKVLYEKWLGVCLKEEALNNMLKLGHFTNKITWLNFLAIAAGYLCPMLSRTMILICEILTEEPDGGSAMIPVETFNSLYTYLAQLNCGGTITLITEEIQSVSSEIDSTESIDITKIHKRSITDIRDDAVKKGIGTDKDSQAGLMVWPDIEPSKEVTSRERPPRPGDRDATSEDGLMVVDDITKPTDGTQVISKTPYPVGDKTQVLDRTPVIKEPQGASDQIDALKTPFTKAIQLVYLDNESAEETYNVNQIEISDAIIPLEDQDPNQTTEPISGVEAINLEFWSAEITMPSSEGNNISDKRVPFQIEEISGNLDKGEEKFPAITPLERKEEKTGNITKENEEQTQATPPPEGKEEETGNITKEDGEQVQATPPPDAKEEEPGNITKEEEEQAQATPPPEGELSAEKIIPPTENLDSLTNVSSQKSEHTEVKELEGTIEFTPPFDSTHIDDIKDSELRDLEDPENKLDRGQNATDNDNILEHDEARNDFEKEISSLPSIKYVGTMTLSGHILGPQEIVKEKLIEDTATISSESKSFVVLDEVQYWENVPGIGPVIPEKQIKVVTEYMLHCASKQEGMVMPRNIRHFLCPSLDYPDTLKNNVPT